MSTIQPDSFQYLTDSIFSSEQEGVTVTSVSCCCSLPGEVQLAGRDWTQLALLETPRVRGWLAGGGGQMCGTPEPG